MKIFLLGVGGAVGCLLSLFLPAEKHGLQNEADWAELIGRLLPLTLRRESSDITLALLLYQPALAVLIALLSAAFLTLFLQRQEDHLQKLAYALCACVVLALVLSYRDLVMRDRRGDLLYSWLVLSGGAISCLVASKMLRYEDWIAPRIQTTGHVSSSPVDVGRCDQCGNGNSKMATRCHACGATLPWVVTKTVASPVPKIPKSPARRLDVGAILTTCVFTFLTFGFCCGAPFLGYFLWKHMDNEDSPYTGVALIGSILGVILHAGRFALRIGQIASTVSG